MIINDISASMVLWTIAIFLTTYIATRVIWFLYFNPLANFPGPKLAAITRWYEFYYDVILDGKYIFKIKELHERYGPIIRITPYELHVDDPEFYDTLYSLTDRREKWNWIQARFDVPDAFISTPSHDLHRMRRAPLQSMFSKQKILNFEPYLQETLNKFARVLREYEKDGRPVRLDHAASAFSGDIVSEYAFATSLNSLESKDFADSLQDAFMTATQTAHISLHFQWIIPIMNSLPDKFVLKLQPKLERLFHLKRVLSELIEDIRYDRNENYKLANHPIIFRELLDSKLPDGEKTPRRLTQEGQAFVGAGFSTTAWAICVGCVHILSNPEVEQKLRTELRNAIPDRSVSPRWLDLEKLPYLKSCIYESIRLSYGAVSRLQRIDPVHTLQYKQWTIPAGTPVSQSHYIVNHSEKIFPDSFSFRPERWIDGGLKMDKFLFSFSKGTRMCIGINLAFAEMYKMFAFLFRHVNMELYKTDLSDVALAHDWFIPGPKRDSKGVYIRILSVQ